MLGIVIEKKGTISLSARHTWLLLGLVALIAIAVVLCDDSGLTSGLAWLLQLELWLASATALILVPEDVLWILLQY